jgi:hypothetical protein
MNKLLTIVALLISWGAFAQQPIVQPVGAPTVLLHNLGAGSFDSVVYLPNRDTTFTPSIPSAIIIRQADGLLYSWTGGPWKVVGTPVWGKITGSLPAQTDLYDSIQARQRTLTNGYGWVIVGGAGTFDSAHVRKVDTMYRVNDSTIGYRINGIVYTALLRGTAAGGINSLVLTVPTVLFSSPVTFSSSGGSWTATLALAPQNVNTFLAGPPSGSPATPTMRAITTTDLPTGIPNANLANYTFGLNIDQTGTVPAFSATSVALGNTILLHLPAAGPTSTGPLTSADWNRFNAGVTGAVTSVNGQVGGVITLNADSLGNYPIDFTNFHNGWVLAIDTIHSKLVFQAPGSGSGITSLNGLLTTTQIFAFGFSGTSPNVVSAGSTHTFNNPIVSGADTGIVTPALYGAWNGKISDSGYSVINAILPGIPLQKLTSGALRFIGWDTSHTNTGGIVTQQWRRALEDSLNSLLATKVANLGASTGIKAGILSARPSASNCQCYYFSTTDSSWSYDNGAWIPVKGGGSSVGATLTFGTGLVPGSYTGATAKTVTVDTIAMATRNALDSIANIRDTITITRLGFRGDTAASANGGNLLSAGQVDSPGLAIHHTINPDGSWTWYANLFSSTLNGVVPLSGGGTTNFLRADGTWAAPPGGGGAVASVTDNGTGTLTISPNTGAVLAGVNEAFGFSWTTSHTFGAGLSFSANILPTANGTLNLGSSSLNLNQIHASNYISPGNANLQAGSGGTSLLSINAVAGLSLLSTRQVQLNAYTATSSFPVTAAGMLVFDASGNVGTQAIPGSTTLTRQVITSGTSATVTGPSYVVTFDLSGPISAYALTMPPSPTDLSIVEIESGGTLTGGTEVMTLTLTPNSGQTIIGPTSFQVYVGTYAKYRYRTSTNQWVVDIVN